jgi:hypothetical protein
MTGTLIGEFVFTDHDQHQYNLEVREDGVYRDGSPAVRLYIKETGEPWATLTVHIRDTVLEPGEYLVKAWSENEETVNQILAAGLFIDTGRRVESSHYAVAQVWRRP